MKATKYGLRILLLFIIAYVINAMGSAVQIQPVSSQGILIFLDDSEFNKVGPITSNFISSFIQEAGPLIVSASLIDNMRSAKKPNETDASELKGRLDEILKSKQASPKEKEEVRNIIAFALDFDTRIKQWIIKKINSSLYLLLPKKYLATKKIDIKSVELFNMSGQLTHSELMLGLKINHLETVKDLNTIKKPKAAVKSAYYFTRALNTLFIMNSEYPLSYKYLIPEWSIYINGHGLMHYSLVHLSLSQFKDFLTFLEKIKTRLLVYSSCYAAGTNANILYADAERGVDITYSFTIIAQALTDASTRSPLVEIIVERDTLKIVTPVLFQIFLERVTNSHTIYYLEAMEIISKIGITGIPQIKYPGLPWFSILNVEEVVSIGSILANTRTAPLKIADFFAKKGKKALPKGILLYAPNIPFELIIETYKPHINEYYVPTFVSMIPGDAVHFIKKISSSHNTAEKILSSFYIEDLKPHKIFIIDRVQAPFGKTLQTVLKAKNGILDTVIIDTLTGHEGVQEIYQYFAYRGEIYRAKGSLITSNPIVAKADTDEINKYNSLLAQHETQEKAGNQLFTSEDISEIQKALEKKIGQEKWIEQPKEQG